MSSTSLRVFDDTSEYPKEKPPLLRIRVCNGPYTPYTLGHAGSDYWQVRAFLDAIINDETPPLDIYAALEITAPGICGGISIEKGGMPVEVPNFRDG